MHPAVMRWTYGREIEKFQLSASELAMLRAICWRFDTRLDYCPALTDRELTRLTGIKGRQVFTNARKHLRALNILSYERERLAKDRTCEKLGPSNGYVYYPHIAEYNPKKEAKPPIGKETAPCPTMP